MALLGIIIFLTSGPAESLTNNPRRADALSKAISTGAEG